LRKRDKRIENLKRKITTVAAIAATLFGLALAAQPAARGAIGPVIEVEPIWPKNLEPAFHIPDSADSATQGKAILALMSDAVPFSPFPIPPPQNQTIEVVPGVHWFSTRLPFRLGTVNQWLIRDHDGWTMVDCSFPDASAQAQLETIWSRVLEGLPITRLVVTHHHLDHAGNGRWICERWGIVPSMTETAYHEAQTNLGPVWKERAPQRLAFLRRHGIPASIGAEINRIWNRGRDHFAQLPERWQSLKEGDVFRIRGNEWRVIVAEGHAPGQALLHAPAMDLLIAGDQILPSISPNVSHLTDLPDATPLAGFLNSNRRIAQACGDVLVLPSHGAPFRGLHARIEELESHHQQRLLATEDALISGSRRAADLLPHLFGRQLSGFDVALALGETLAHLQYLVHLGRALRVEQNGVVLFSALPRG